jgi:hypothetical protein
MSVTFGAYTPPEKEDEKTEYILGIFFDGTNNNKNNTNAKEAYSKQKKGEKLSNAETQGANAYKKYSGDPMSSYENEWSNVARLWDCYAARKNIYVDGIGTNSLQSDETEGSAVGAGKTGIPERMKEGCRLLVEKLKGTKQIDTLTIDVFGFSRGAATARYFVHELSNIGAKSKTENPPIWTYKWGYFGYFLKQNGIEVRLLKIRFLGLFDTVSSYGASTNFSNDVTELSLNNISKAKNIIHFTAMDEHRENFSLTHTHIGIEKMLPGVHSDIGGSYGNGIEIVNEIETSKTTNDKLEKFKKKLVEQNWYTDDQLEIIGGIYSNLKGTRKNLKNTYSFIPLQFMTELATAKEVPINSQNLKENKYKISDDPLLIRVKNRLQKYILGDGLPYSFKWYGDIHEKYKNTKQGDNQFSKYQEEIDEQKDLRLLRNKYLHWNSNREGIGMDPTNDRIRKTY